MTFLIVHGINGYAGIDWQKWLHDQLVELGHTVVMPNMPDASHPNRTTWFTILQQKIVPIPKHELSIIGHSLGVASCLDLIERLTQPIKAFVSVSGFYQDYGLENNSYFMKGKNIDFQKVNLNVEQKYVIYGSDDSYAPRSALQAIADQFQVDPIVIRGGGHLNASSGYTKFPQLLDIVKNIR